MSKSSLEDDDSKTSKSNENNDEELSFQLSQEIYDMLLRNIVPESDENQNIIIGFENQRSDVAKSLEQAKEIKETPNFTSIIKVNQKKTSKKAALVSFENGKLIEKLDIEQFGEISIAKVWIKHFNMNLELMTQPSQSLKTLKAAVLKNLESFYKESFFQYEQSYFRFSAKDIEITNEDEELSLNLLISKNKLEECLVGNLFTIDFMITDKKIELEILKKVFVKNKEPDELLRIFIKLNKINGKNSNRILTIKEDQKGQLILLLSKFKSDSQTIFPMISIKSIEKMPSFKEDNELLDAIKAQIFFRNDLKWPPLIIWFVVGNTYNQFYEIFNDFINKSSPKLIKQTSKNQISTEEILRQTKDINIIMDQMDKEHQKYVEEELKKLTAEETIEKIFQIKQKNMLKIRSDRVAKFTQTDFEIYKPNYSTLISSYPLNEIESANIVEKKPKKIKMNIKNNKKSKFIKFYLNSNDEALSFINYFNNTIKEEFQKNIPSDSRSFLQKDLKRYSWLCPAKKLNEILLERPTEVYFNVIHKKKHENHQKLILHLNINTKNINLLRINRQIFRQIEMNKILSVANCNFDSRRIYLSWSRNEKKKIEDLIFNDIKTKFVFLSAVYSVLYPDYKEIKNESFTVYITSWNVGFSEPPENISDSWIKSIEEIDLICIGIQECKANSWIEKLQTTLRKKGFYLATVSTMWRMMLCVFIQQKYFNLIKNLEVVSKPTGIANIIGNKGGIMVTFEILDSSFCFITCHLAAKPNNIELRKANYYDLIRSLRTGIHEVEAIFQFDYVFWCGDMNFRVDMPFDKVVELSEKKNYGLLWEHDQLTKERNSNTIFSDFNEGSLDFRPTYRRIRNDDTWSNKKNQSPSWCDRILFRTKPGKMIDLIEYGSREDQYGSDHRPIYGIYKLEIEYPYIGNPPLYLRKNIPDGFIKLSNLNLNFDFKTLMNIGEINLGFPCEIAMFFSGNFLNKNPSTSNYKLDLPDNNTKINWKKDGIPVLFCAISDFKFLKRNYVMVTVVANDSSSNNEIIIGEGFISLKDVIENNGNEIQFETYISLFGKIFGSIEGNIAYDIENSQVFII